MIFQFRSTLRWTDARALVFDEADSCLFCHSLHDLPELTEIFHGLGTVRLEDQFGLPNAARGLAACHLRRSSRIWKHLHRGFRPQHWFE